MLCERYASRYSKLPPTDQWEMQMAEGTSGFYNLCDDITGQSPLRVSVALADPVQMLMGDIVHSIYCGQTQHI